MTKELLHELKKGVAQLTITGTAIIGADTFKGVIQPGQGKHWVSVRTSIPIDIGDGVRVFPEINDGYMNNNPIIRRFKNDTSDGSGMLEIPFKDRLSDEYKDKVASYSLYATNITKDEQGKPIRTTFIHGIDFEEFIKQNLKDGMEVTVRGDAEYSLNKDGEKEYRNYKIKAIYLNEDYEKNGETQKASPHTATITQTYLMEAGALDKRWEKELETEGKTKVSVYVPEYLSKKWNGQSYAPFKKTIPIKQVLTLVCDPNDEKSLKRTKILAKRMFDVPKKKIREIGIIVKINEGVEKGTASIEIDKDLQELIDLGLMTEEDVKKQVTVRGNRVSELVVLSPRVLVDNEGKTKIDMDDEKYAADALLFPILDEDNDVSTSTSDSEATVGSEGMSDDMFDSLFGEDSLPF